MRAPLAIGGLLAAIALISIGCRRASSSDAGRAPSFLARLEFPTASSGRSKPTGLIAGDIDGDGVDEIVAATRSPGGIEIWSRISPVIGPAPEPKVFSFGDYPIGPVWLGGGDASNKHPRSLAAVASRETLELAVIDLAASMKSSAGSELSVRWRAKLPARPRAIASGDLGRDGKPEVAVITIEDELLLYSDASAPRRIPLAHEHAVCALLTSDGERIAIGYQGSRSIALLRADGAQEKSVEIHGLPRAFTEVDLDGDGDTELVVASGDEELLVFGLGRAGGSATWFDGKPLEVKVGRVPIALAHAPFRGGREEIAVLDLHDQDLRILAISATAHASITERAAGQHPLDLAIGDFDGDGALDIAVANADARRVGVFFGASDKKRAGPCFVSESRIPCDRSPTSIAAGDVDGDGRPEVAVIASADETVSILRNAGGELVGGEVGVPAPGAMAVAIGKVPPEGKVGVAWVRRGSGGSSLVTALGGLKGKLEDRAIRGSTDAADLLFAEIGTDKEPVAVIADPERGFVSVVGASSGDHATPVPSGPRALALLRGAQLVAIASGGPGTSRGIYLARITGTELQTPTLLPMTQYPIAICAADLDGDGREDLAVLATEAEGDSQGLVIPWIAKADGGWRALNPMPTGARPFKIAACDLDGDGKAEILVTAQGSHHVELWLGRAGLPVRFVRAPDLGAGTGPLDLVLVDLDGDGKKEIVVANGFSDDVSVIRVR